MFTRQAEQNRRKWEHLVPSVHCVAVITLRLKRIQLNDSRHREEELVNESPFNRQRSASLKSNLRKRFGCSASRNKKG